MENDPITVAYAKWSEAHKLLMEAEQQLALLPRTAHPSLRDAAHAHVQELRARSDELLADAQSTMRAAHGLPTTQTGKA